MELYLVIICSLLTINNIYASDLVEPTDESILDKIIRADQEEGTEHILNQADILNVQCAPPKPPDNGYIKGPILLHIGAVIHIGCNHSYHLLGDDTIRCEAVPSPFEHKALWFHGIGDLYYSSKPKCIRQIDLPENSKRQDTDEDEIKNQPPNVPIIRPEPTDAGDEVNDDPASPPPPLISQGKAKTIADERVHFPPEESNTDQEENDLNKHINEEPILRTNTKPEPNCVLRSETGPCRASKPRFYYNIDSKRCELFIYGGCKGNGNNYMSKEDCEKTCNPQRAPGSSSKLT